MLPHQLIKTLSSDYSPALLLLFLVPEGNVLLRNFVYNAAKCWDVPSPSLMLCVRFG